MVFVCPGICHEIYYRMCYGIYYEICLTKFMSLVKKLEIVQVHFTLDLEGTKEVQMNENIYLMSYMATCG